MYNDGVKLIEARGEESGTIVSYVLKKATDLPLLFCMVAIVLVK